MKIICKESRKVQKKILTDKNVEKLLAILRHHHEDSYAHSLRVGLLSIDLGFENKINRGHLMVLGYAAHLHDIGKRDIGLNVLEKAAALNHKERGQIKEHPRSGFATLDAEGLSDVKQLVVRHHEYQSIPYPRNPSDRRKKARQGERRKGKKYLDRLGEMLSLADMFDALTTRRAYKKELPKDKVVEILRNDFVGNKHFIEQVLRRF